MDKTQMLVALSAGLFALGLLGVIVRRNVLVMLMCMELMLNGVNVMPGDLRATGRLDRRSGAGVPGLRRGGRRESRSRSPSCCCSRGASARSTSMRTWT